MNIPLAFVLLSAAGYFASSVYKTTSQAKNESRSKFRSIVSVLEGAATSVNYVQKQLPGAYLIWPKGIYGGITFDGVFATYIVPIEPSLSFQVASYVYVKSGDQKSPAWQRIENFVTNASEFELRIQSVLGLPMDTKLKLMNAHGPTGGSPPAPPRRH